MAAGNYSGTKAERDDTRRLARVERRHLAEDPEGERREIREILRLKGLKGDVAGRPRPTRSPPTARPPSR